MLDLFGNFRVIPVIFLVVSIISNPFISLAVEEFEGEPLYYIGEGGKSDVNGFTFWEYFGNISGYVVGQEECKGTYLDSASYQMECLAWNFVNDECEFLNGRRFNYSGKIEDGEFVISSIGIRHQGEEQVATGKELEQNIVAVESCIRLDEGENG